MAPSEELNVEINAGPRQSDGKRLVMVHRDGAEVLRDQFDTDKRRQLTAFVQRVVELVGQPDALEVLRAEVLGKADAADRHLLQQYSAQAHAPSRESRSTPQSSELVELAAEVDFFHTPEGIAYASLPTGGHRENCEVKSRSFREWLGHAYYQQCGRVPSSQAIQDALGVLEGRAKYDCPEVPVYTRLAQHEESIYLDLADRSWSAVRINSEGWQIVAAPPVKFRRPSGMLPLPQPERGGDLGALREFVNVAEEDLPLLYSWLVTAASPGGPYPLLNISGEQGTCKSTLSKVLRRMLDPNVAELRSEPRQDRDLMIAANNNWILPFDNLSFVPPWLSDALCRLSTGGGYATRALYTDTSEVILNAKRPIMLNGIEETGNRSDLLDRSILLRLVPIEPARRRTEASFWSSFDAAHPRMLGALLDAVSIGLRNLPTTQLEELPRMADFATWVTACEPGLPFSPGDFARRYSANRENVHELALDGCPVAVALRQFMQQRTRWDGTPTELFEALSGFQSINAQRIPGGTGARTPRTWPTNAQRLSGVLSRMAPNLRSVGLSLEIYRSGTRRVRITRLTDSAPHRVENCASSFAPPAAIGQFSRNGR